MFATLGSKTRPQSHLTAASGSNWCFAIGTHKAVSFPSQEARRDRSDNIAVIRSMQKGFARIRQPLSPFTR